jgi:hypothetical protein
MNSLVNIKELTPMFQCYLWNHKMEREGLCPNLFNEDTFILMPQLDKDMIKNEIIDTFT